MRVVWGRRDNKKGSAGSGSYSRLSTLAGPDPCGKVPRVKVFVLSVLARKSLVEYTGSVSAWYEKQKGRLQVLRNSGSERSANLLWTEHRTLALGDSQEPVGQGTMREGFMEETGSGSRMPHE